MSILILVLHGSQGRQIRFFECDSHYSQSVGEAGMDGKNKADELGWASLIATKGSALVCKFRFVFSSWNSRRVSLLPEPLERCDRSERKLIPRLRRGVRV